MVKRKKNHSASKRSLTSALPKGLPVRNAAAMNVNPFESLSRHNKRPKHATTAAAPAVAASVASGKNKFKASALNKGTSSSTSSSTSLAQAMEHRKKTLRQQLQASKKKNAFVDKRIGEYNAEMTPEEQNLARLVRERTRRSKRSTKYSLDDDHDNDDKAGHISGRRGGLQLLTHGGKSIDSLSAEERAKFLPMDDDDDEDGGQLDAVDTLRHFGGGGGPAGDGGGEDSAYYGPSGGSSGGGGTKSLAQMYTFRKMELDDYVLRRKVMKQERLQSKEAQVDAFEEMDKFYATDLAPLLAFRDHRQQPGQPGQQQQGLASISSKPRLALSKNGKDDNDDDDDAMGDWDKQLKEFQFLQRRKVAATDRTKTPEEIARERAERLHELETKRLARMNGDFDNENDDDLLSLSSDNNDNDKKRKYKKRKKSNATNPEDLDGHSESEPDEELQTRFTADGLVQVDKKTGMVVKKLGDHVDDKNADMNVVVLEVGTRVSASYRANEQFDGNESWYDGVITKVNHHDDKNKSNNNNNGTTTTTSTNTIITYDIDYDDGDFEQEVEPRHVRELGPTEEEIEKKKIALQEEEARKRKRQKAREKARSEIPFVFEVPTTLESLHDLIATFASTGKDASTIIERIHSSNSVRLDRRNAEKMQNFYDVCLRRFIAVGDAIFASGGDGGPELGRFGQLDALTKVLYDMAQDAPESAGAVWARRLGIFQNAHAKRLRDAAFIRDKEGLGEDKDDEDHSAWPSTGIILTLRAMGHIFPVTDKRHYVVTSALLLLGQMIAQTPIDSMYDLVMGTMCSALLIQYTKDAKRLAPEAHAYLAGVIRLFAAEPSKRIGPYPTPSLEAAVNTKNNSMFAELRKKTSKLAKTETPPRLSLEKSAIQSDAMPAAVLFTALSLVEQSAQNLTGSIGSAEKEVFAEITESLLALQPKHSSAPLPTFLLEKVASVASVLRTACETEKNRVALCRRVGASAAQVRSIKTLAPRLEDPERFGPLSQKKNKKTSSQAALDRTRRELKREHKTVSRELRLDSRFVESERRTEQEKRDATAKAKRNKNFAWLEGEQAAMNQQVRQGGGLLSGGGTGLARAKAKSGKLGMKKGGKFS